MALGEFWGAAHLLSVWLSHKSMEVSQQWGPSAEERATSQHELGLGLSAWLKTKTWGLGGIMEKVERKLVREESEGPRTQEPWLHKALPSHSIR